MLAPSIICRTCSTLSATTAVTPPRARASSEVMLITAPRTETPISLKPTDNKQRMVCLMDSLSPACMGLLRVVRPLVPHPMVRGHPSQPPNQPPNHLTRTKDSMHPSRSRRRRCPPQSLSPTPSLPRHPRHWHGAVSLILQATNKVLRPMLKERVNPPPLRSPVSLYTTRSDAPVLDYCLVRLLYSSSLSLTVSSCFRSRITNI
ncbi:hypothetical protein PLEOSDRAFT_176393 [Pleurotus ostreatus PC15]|uniref:Uncharacterized protein n=1 Tax=Pleurotus ostreatus (strain PC15) TaxID=1137138 RepID=A0A067NHZ0_PLEO1|nr:hypothetical protein PLEOSDRAFT_176393 [Pleurotus ostreatus PC15]